MRLASMIGRIGACLLAFSATTPAEARAQNQPRANVYGSVGFGTLADDEGSLGGGVAAGGGAGWAINDRFAIEVAVIRSRHEQTGSLSWVGRPLTVTARGRYLFGAAEARTRPFVGGGVGYLRYPGTFTESVFSSPTSAPTQLSSDWLVSSVVAEVGAGLEIRVGRSIFVRPEAWLAMASPTRVRPAPEPPYTMPRVAISLGARF
jgi:hypothetical protein